MCHVFESSKLELHERLESNRNKNLHVYLWAIETKSYDFKYITIIILKTHFNEIYFLNYVVIQIGP